MVKVSIICLIYKSTEFSDWVYESVKEFTPMLLSWEAEFFFVANDPTSEVVKHLESKHYPHYVNVNPVHSEQALYAAWYWKPEYIGRVYRGYNEWIIRAKWEVVVLLNSDNFVSKDWLENLLKYLDRTHIVSSTLVERNHPIYWVFPGAINKNFWEDIGTFRKEEFINWVEKTKKTGVSLWKAYMPCAVFRDVAIEAGLYPEWNLAGWSYDEIVQYGDEVFYRSLEKMGVRHVTSLDSIVYHLKEGEKGNGDIVSLSNKDVLKITPIPYRRPFENRRIDRELIPNKRHFEIIDQLLWIRQSLALKIKKTVNIRMIKNIIYELLLRFGLLNIVKKILWR